jgi:hypothetical protein
VRRGRDFPLPCLTHVRYKPLWAWLVKGMRAVIFQSVAMQIGGRDGSFRFGGQSIFARAIARRAEKCRLGPATLLVNRVARAPPVDASNVGLELMIDSLKAHLHRNPRLFGLARSFIFAARHAFPPIAVQGLPGRIHPNDFMTNQFCPAEHDRMLNTRSTRSSILISFRRDCDAEEEHSRNWTQRWTSAVVTVG